MLTDPAFDVPVGKIVLPEGAVSLWREALRRSEPELVKAAADSIVTAHKKEFEGLEQCADNLTAAASANLEPDALFAVCRALVALNVREAAETLWKVSQSRGPEFQYLIEPVLGEWGHPGVRNSWRARVADPKSLRRELILACEGLSRLEDHEAVPPLVALATRRTLPSDVRLAAARAAGQIADEGLEDDAARLIENSSHKLIDDLCGVSLIRRHTSPQAQRILLSVPEHENPTVAEPALRALLEIDPALVLPLAAAALSNDDAKVRQCGLDAYIALPSVEHISIIAGTMNDRHPDVRICARQALHRFSTQEEYDQPVLDQCLKVLSADDWRGQEQAALLAGALGYSSAAPRLVELLESDRGEPAVASAWALRILNMPETADAILDQAERVTEHVLSTPVSERRPGCDEQLGHLFEALVVFNDARAVPVMRQHVPKDVSREKSRSAAIWGLGKLLEDQPDERLAAELMTRIRDTDSSPPELDLVRQMSAITIGRMNVTPAVEALQQYLGPKLYPTPMTYALAWSIERMGAEVPPREPPEERTQLGWPIEPVPPRRDPLNPR